MVTTADVMLWGNPIGIVVWNEQRGSGVFQYYPEFTAKGIQPSPLVMPAGAEQYEFSGLSRETFMGLPGLLADALPDAFGQELLNRWLVSVGRIFANPVERLCYQGNRCMGALEFLPSYAGHLSTSEKIEIDELVAVVGEVLNQKSALQTSFNEDKKEAIASIIRVGTSAGGQRAKAVIAYNDETGEVRSGQVEAPKGFDYWLLKLDGVTNKQLGDPEHFGEIEYIHYLLARKAGIEMTECRLLEENGRAHFMTKRFDRVDGEKVHMQTLCGLAHYDFRMMRAYSYEQAFQVMRRLRLPYPQAEEFYRRMVYNVVARNQDDHTKNISFLMDKSGTWRLSPAYDMSWAYNPQGSWTSSHQMSINMKWDNITREDLLTVAKNMNIKHAKEIIDQVNEAISQWRDLAGQYEIAEEVVELIERTRNYV